MIDKLQRLYANDIAHAGSKFEAARGRSARSILTDLLDIYDPESGAIKKLFRHLVIETGIVDLVPRRRDPRPDFRVNVMLDLHDKLSVTTEGLSLPGRAAGWAALQLYRETSSDLTLSHLNVIDPSPESAARAMGHGRRPVSEEEDISLLLRASLETFASQSRGLLIIPDVHHSGSMVVMKNKDRAPLPDLLQTVKDRYDQLYPEQQGATSAAVAGIVGAGNLDEFQGVWNEAKAMETPVIAARTLLASGVFLAPSE